MERTPINTPAVVFGCGVLACTSGYALFRGGGAPGWSWIDLVFIVAVAICTLLVVRMLSRGAASTLDRAVRRTRPVRHGWDSARRVRHHRA